MNLVDYAKYQQMLQVLGQQSPMMPQADGLLGPMMADKGDRRREDHTLAQASTPSAPWEMNIVTDNQYGPDRINDQRHPAPRVEYMEVPKPTEGKPHDWTHVTKEPDGTLRYWNLPRPMM